jgi:hypothetical protein
LRCTHAKKFLEDLRWHAEILDDFSHTFRLVTKARNSFSRGRFAALEAPAGQPIRGKGSLKCREGIQVNTPAHQQKQVQVLLQSEIFQRSLMNISWLCGCMPRIYLFPDKNRIEEQSAPFSQA